MTTYRLWPSTNGGPLVSYAGNFIAGTVFAVKGGGNWFNGYYWWVPTGGDTTPVKCALWSASSTVAGHGGGTSYVVPGTVVTSGALTANAWNYIPLATPVQLAPTWDTNLTTNGSCYIAAIGWTAVNGFPDTNNYWGTGQIAPGITNGPLHAFLGTSGGGGAGAPPYAFGQGVFSTAGTDPSVTMPQSISNTDNFWVDVSVSDTAPAGYSGSYRLWPNKTDANQITSGDAAFNYTVATEIHLTQACTLNNIWYFSVGNATTLATRCDVWSISSGTSVASITSPSWTDRTGASYTAGSATNGAWIKAAFPAGVSLPPGSYRVSVYNSSGSTDANWSPKDAGTDYWGQTLTGAGSGGITSGPLYAPDYPNAASGYVYGGAGTDTPPWSSGGTVQAHAQPVFYEGSAGATGVVGFPQLYAVVNTDQTQNYWVDLEVTPQPPGATSDIVPVPPGLAHPLSFFHPAGIRSRLPHDATLSSVVTQWTASLSGLGTLSASPQLAGSADLTGVGTLSALPQTLSSAALSGLGTLSALPQILSSADLTGIGTLSASAATNTSAALSGLGTLSAAPQMLATASLSGLGTLSASPQLAAAASLSGLGTLSASPTGVASAALSGLGSLSASPLLAGSAALSGQGALSAAAQFLGQAALSGLGTLSASPSQSGGGSASLSGQGTLSAAATLIQHVSAALSGLGTLSASPAIQGQTLADPDGLGGVLLFILSYGGLLNVTTAYSGTLEGTTSYGGDLIT